MSGCWVKNILDIFRGRLEGYQKGHPTLVHPTITALLTRSPPCVPQPIPVDWSWVGSPHIFIIYKLCLIFRGLLGDILSLLGFWLWLLFFYAYVVLACSDWHRFSQYYIMLVKNNFEWERKFQTYIITMCWLKGAFTKFLSNAPLPLPEAKGLYHGSVPLPIV